MDFVKQFFTKCSVFLVDKNLSLNQNSGLKSDSTSNSFKGMFENKCRECFILALKQHMAYFDIYNCNKC